MDISVRTAQTATVKTQLLGVPVFGDFRKDIIGTELDDALGGVVFQLAREEKFNGKSGQRLTISGSTGIAAQRVVFLGLGKPQKSLAAQLRTFAHKIGHLVREKGLSRFALATPSDSDVDLHDVIQWLTEGALSGIYRYEELLTGDRKPKKAPNRCVLIIAKGQASTSAIDMKSLKNSISIGNAIAAGVNLARDLVNTPSNLLSPTDLAHKASSLADECGLSITVRDEKEIAELGMGLLTAVGQGSSSPPRFVHLTYQPEGKQQGVVALVGKGVTFDSGGLSLKTAKGMIEMKSDMAGAAVVLGALKAVAVTGSKYLVHGLIPLAENMPGGEAIRPGDVFRSFNGKTVEILNTDAEGRLILADALSFAAGLQPNIILDFATLTGASMVALGGHRSALFSSNDTWTCRLYSAADKVGELFWTMPLAQELREGLQSQIADLRNMGGTWGGAISAALFLKEFVGTIPWIHLDIAGPAYLEKPHGFYPKGGTGFCVLTIVEMLRSGR